MEAILYYIIKVTVTSGLLLLYYHLFLKDKAFHRFNRFFLVGATLGSLTIPLIDSDYFILPVNKDVFSVVSEFKNSEDLAGKSSFSIFFGIVLGLVALIFISRFILGSYKIIRLKKSFPKEIYMNISFYSTDLHNAPFSYFKNLFWKDSITVDSKIGRQIFEHEMAHIKQRHTYDKLLIEFVKCVFWFNPFFYIIKREIHLVHEYLADRAAFPKSDVEEFAQMLLTSHFSGGYSTAVNPLFNSSLTKRIKMLKQSTTKFSSLRVISSLSAVLVTIVISIFQLQENGIKAIDTFAVSVVKAYKDPSPVQQTSLVKDSTTKNLDLNNKNLLENNSKESQTPSTRKMTGITQVNEFTAKNINTVNTVTVTTDSEIEAQTKKLPIDELQKERKNADQAARDAQIARTAAAKARKDADKAAHDAQLARIHTAKARKDADQARRDAQLARTDAAKSRKDADQAKRDEHFHRNQLAGVRI